MEKVQKKQGGLKMNKPGIFIVGFCFGVIILGCLIVAFESILTEDDKKLEDDFEEARRQQEYRQSTERLYNESGVPSQYTCEQMRVMYISDVYPKHVLNYECKDSPESNYSWCKTHYFGDTRETFVKYYLLNCLEQKE